MHPMASKPLLLTNNTQIQITLYRSPSIPLQTLTDLLSRILNRISASSLPTIVLGEDVLHHTDRIMNFMSRHGYTQRVNLPITNKGTLSDHVYF